MTDDSNEQISKSPSNSSVINSQAYADAAETYLIKFGDLAKKTLQEYQIIAQNYITFTSPKSDH